MCAGDAHPPLPWDSLRFSKISSIVNKTNKQTHKHETRLKSFLSGAPPLENRGSWILFQVYYKVRQVLLHLKIPVTGVWPVIAIYSLIFLGIVQFLFYALSLLWNTSCWPTSDYSACSILFDIAQFVLFILSWFFKYITTNNDYSVLRHHYGFKVLYIINSTLHARTIMILKCFEINALIILRSFAFCTKLYPPYCDLLRCISLTGVWPVTISSDECL